MKKVKIIALFVLCLFTTLILNTQSAYGAFIIPSNQKAKDNSKAPVNSPVIDENWDLERVDFIHYAKPTSTNQGGKNTSCYKLMGVKWNTTNVPYVINPSNPQGLDETFVTSTFQKSAENWDSYSSRELLNDTPTIDYTAVYGVRDYKNSIAFGPYSSNSAIAVTSVWYTRVGKQIVEFDQIYNTYFSWGDASVDNTKMDLENIAVHELGHAVGLSDLYSNECSSVTMYGYSGEGEISKRTLEQPDIDGLRRIYGL